MGRNLHGDREEMLAVTLRITSQQRLDLIARGHN